MKTLRSLEFQKRFERFLRSLRFGDRVFLIFDKDVDGVTSGVITEQAFKKLGIKFAEIIPDFFIERKFYNLKKFDAGVVVDVPTQTQEKFLRKTEKKILVIDHHPSRDVQSKNIFYINPRLIKKEIYQPTSYTAFKIFSNFIDLSKEKWIAILGTVGDYGFEDVRDLLGNKVKSKKDIWKTEYGKAATKLNSAIAIYGSKKSFAILKNCKGLKDFATNKKIQLAHEKFSKEFWKVTIEVKKSSEIYPFINLIFAIITPKYNRIAPALATKISTENRNKLVVLAEKIGNEYKIHGRAQNGRIHVGEILKNFGGGGHGNAGACIISTEKLPAFKKKLVEILKKNK